MEVNEEVHLLQVILVSDKWGHYFSVEFDAAHIKLLPHLVPTLGTSFSLAFKRHLMPEGTDSRQAVYMFLISISKNGGACILPNSFSILVEESV